MVLQSTMVHLATVVLPNTMVLLTTHILVI